MIDSIIFGYLVFFSIHFIIFLLYQFDILRIREKSMIRWIRVTNVLETVFLIITHASQSFLELRRKSEGSQV